MTLQCEKCRTRCSESQRLELLRETFFAFGRDEPFPDCDDYKPLNWYEEAA